MRIGHGRCPWCTAECRRSGRAFGIRVTRKGSHRKGCFSSAVLLGSVEHPDTVRGLNKGQGFIQKQQALYKDDPGFRTDERSHKTDSDSKSGNTTCLFIGGMSLPIERRTYGELIAAILKKCFFPLHEFRSENAAPEVIAIPVCLEVLIVFVMPSVPLKDDLKSMPYRKHENSASSSCCPEDKSKNIENTETRKKRKRTQYGDGHPKCLLPVVKPRPHHVLEDGLQPSMDSAMDCGLAHPRILCLPSDTSRAPKEYDNQGKVLTQESKSLPQGTGGGREPETLSLNVVKLHCDGASSCEQADDNHAHFLLMLQGKKGLFLLGQDLKMSRKGPGPEAPNPSFMGKDARKANATLLFCKADMLVPFLDWTFAPITSNATD
ncbi:hypothetical protein MJG53_015966 [Ovis ammon polii x Ovis aries]|uniref:Uncharacterized protein n=1 Tax=Ovis ammon polii x Ovis aries TaxID=2918886 RepID=A0ACB9UCU3_9CETA|nr:hypothetical protein MJG53_015966 [Ovis ammon polii x Ovis aries]